MTNESQPVAEPKRLSARELLKLSREERDAILERAAIIAEPLYRSDPDLTAFEAFGPNDLHGESSSSETW
jgi:hypothetical protein